MGKYLIFGVSNKKGQNEKYFFLSVNNNHGFMPTKGIAYYSGTIRRILADESFSSNY